MTRGNDAPHAYPLLVPQGFRVHPLSGLAVASSLARDAIRVHTIEMPLSRVVGDVLADRLKVPVVAQNVLVKAMLPESPRISRPTIRGYTLAVPMRGVGFETLDDRRQREDRSPTWRTLTLIFERARIGQEKDPVDMIRHHDRRVHRYAGVVDTEIVPDRCDHLADRRSMNFVLNDSAKELEALLNAQRDKVRSRTRVIVPRQADGVARRIRGHRRVWRK